LNGNVSELDIAKILNDSIYFSDLNFSYFAKGEGLNVDTMTGNFVVTIDSSRFNETEINDVGLELVLQLDEEGRAINLKSDLLDLNINGSFSLQKAIGLLSYEAEIISQIIADKMGEINPLLLREDTLAQESFYVQDEIVSNDLEFEYDFQFKDLNLLATFIQEDKLDISGSGYGTVENNPDNFSISTSINFDHIIRKKNSNIFYLSDFETDVNFSRDNKSTSFNNLLGSVSITGNRLNAGADINNIFADIIFNQSKLFFNVEAELDTILTSAAEGTVEMSLLEQKVSFENLECNYKGLNWQNEEPITVLFTPEYLDIKDFTLNHNETKIRLDGTIYNEERQKVNISINDLPGEYLSKYFLALNKNYIDANVMASININGSFEKPLLDIELTADSISYQRINFGNLLCDLTYDNKLLKSEVSFVDTTNNLESPLLELSSKIPLDLRFKEVAQRFLKTEDLEVSLNASNFNSSAFGDLLPFITDQRGMLTADVNANGTLENLNLNGFLSLTGGRFKARPNNLSYDYGLNLFFDGNSIAIDSLILLNSGGSKYNGTLNGSGNLKFDGTNIEDINVFINGDLALLGKRSRAVSPYLYGDLFIGTGDGWNFSYKDGNFYLDAKIILKNTNLTYSSKQTATGTASEEFVYEIKIDSTKLDTEELKLRKLIADAETEQDKIKLDSDPKINFDYNIEVIIEQDAKLIFLLSPIWNQKLIVEAKGDIKYESINGEPNIQGDIELQEGSKLEFFKNFDAEGSIQFTAEPANPYLDVIATYRGEILIDTVETDDVAVKIKLEGPLNELGKNLMENPDNIAVYVGARNIDQDIPDRRYDVSDAVTFILIGKFLRDDQLTSTDKSRLAGETAYLSPATSFLGSV
ncbi:MAG: translocation/assembly module TamB domain-containing protein, partial [Promethearchaeota archaeon]